MNQQEKKALIELIVPRLIKMIMEQQTVNEQDAFTILYSSELYRQLDREETKLCTLYGMLNEEQETGKITYPEEA